MAQLLGIDFGYSTSTASLGYIRFETQTRDDKLIISVASPSATTTLTNFLTDILQEVCDDGVSLIALDAPISPQRLLERPSSGRQVEKRFSRGDFHNSRRGPQPSSISVPRQGWPLYVGAMDLMDRLNNIGFKMPCIEGAYENASVSLIGNVCVEVCPKMTQSLLAPKSLVVNRPKKRGLPSFYRQIDNWLFSHLFVTAAPEDPKPSGGLQPQWGANRRDMCSLLGDRFCIDNSVWDEAARISSVTPLSKRHELIGAFVAGFQGAIALAGASVVVGARGDYEGYYVLPSKWHSDWSEVWNSTQRNEDIVNQFPIKLPTLTVCPSNGEGQA